VKLLIKNNISKLTFIICSLLQKSSVMTELQKKQDVLAMLGRSDITRLICAVQFPT